MFEGMAVLRVVDRFFGFGKGLCLFEEMMGMSNVCSVVL